MSSAPRKKERSSDGSTRVVCKLRGCEKPSWPSDRELETAKTYHHQRYHQESARIVYQGRSVEIRRDPATGKFPCPCGEPQHARRMAINTRTLCRPRVHPPPDTPSAGEAATDDEGFGFRRATGTQSSAGGGSGNHASAESNAKLTANAAGRTRSAASASTSPTPTSAPNAASAPLPRKRRRASPEVIEVGSDSEDGGTVLVKHGGPVLVKHGGPVLVKRVKREPGSSDPGSSSGGAPVRRGEGGAAMRAAEDAARGRRETKTERELTLEEKFERNKALERKLHEVSSGFQPAVTSPVFYTACRFACVLCGLSLRLCFPRLVTPPVLSAACHSACAFHGLRSPFFCAGTLPLACAESCLPNCFLHRS
ncbi:hypothetical protein FB107DRAFT_215854 [Schizophyllum commune]